LRAGISLAKAICGDYVGKLRLTTSAC